jgi:hypothetical protein
VCGGGGKVIEWIVREMLRRERREEVTVVWGIDKEDGGYGKGGDGQITITTSG